MNHLSRIVVYGVPLCLAFMLLIAGCTPGGGSGNSNTNTNTNSSTDRYASVDPGDAGKLVVAPDTPGQSTLDVDVASQIQNRSPRKISVDLDDVDVAIASGDPLENDLDLVLRIGDSTDTVCTNGFALPAFNIAQNTNGVIDVSPSSVEATSNAFEDMTDGKFAVCLEASANATGEIEIDKLTFHYEYPDPSTLTCAEIMDLPDVKAAIEILSQNGHTFSIVEGNTPHDITGEYDFNQVVEFDPDNTDTGNTSEGVITFSAFGEGQVDRTGFGATITEAIQGTDESVSLCILARTNSPGCDQQIARIETLSISDSAPQLTGHVVSVVVERYTNTTGTCGEEGDFIYGPVLFTQRDSSFAIEQIAKIDMPAGFKPDLMVLPQTSQSVGLVTDEDSALAYRFQIRSPFSIGAVEEPQNATPDYFNGIAISSDDSSLSLTSNSPAIAFVYDANTGYRTEQSRADKNLLSPFYYDFSLDSKELYIASPDPDDVEDRIAIFDVDQVLGETPGKSVYTPDNLWPDLTRLSPDGNTLAVLMSDRADDGKGRYLGFIDLETDRFNSTVIDLVEAEAGVVYDRDLEFGLLGQQVFLCGSNGIVVASVPDDSDQTPEVTLIDVTPDTADPPSQFALSNDGRVLAVSVQSVDGVIDYAVISTETLQVIHTETIPGLAGGYAFGVAHFGNARAAMIMSAYDEVYPVQTIEPYTVDAPFNLNAGSDDPVRLGRIIAGYDTIGVTNIDEDSIYLFQAPDSMQ